MIQKCVLCGAKVKDKTYLLAPLLFWLEEGHPVVIMIQCADCVVMPRFFLCEEDYTLFKKSPDVLQLLLEAKVDSLVKKYMKP